MRYLLTTVAMALMPLMSMVASTKQYFKDGTKWKTLLSGITSDENGPYTTSSYSYVWLDGEETVDGYQALRMYCSDENESENNLYAYIRTDGDKVYFRPAGIADAPWYLMYDFGLNVGDECYVYDASNFDYYPSMHPSYIKCIGLEEDNATGLTSMIVEKHYEEGDPVKPTFVWYKGLASNLGVLYNNTIDLVGLDTRLVEVTCDGNVVYKSETTAVDHVDAGELKATVNGLDVTIEGVNPSDRIALFATDGKLLRQFTAEASTALLTLPGHGMYILKVGGLTKKVVAVQQ